ncbi:MAG: DUF5107 domain-containing protein [Lachnospiraceae bacterium]|nr:DUF5107 domain-containing protein [Lachnospiraceae bacterium]
MAQVRVEKVTIPTYETFEYDKNPMFLEKRVYQGSSGRVYPHPVCEGICDEKKDKEYTAVFMENDYILVMILPELGGRIQRLYDKTNGYDAVYYNEVIKPALVGLAGPWISGGIEFNWPQHHRPSTFDPVDFCVTHNDDGSVTVTVGETEKMFHTKGNASFTIYDDKAYLEIKGLVYNPTEREQTFLWWANPAVAVNDYTRSIFPPDVTAVFDHGKRDVSDFPIATGVYYKVNYAPGTDISRYKNIPVPTSYMAHHSDYDFIGNYDDSKNAGLLHVADHHVSPGKKQWTWGNGDFGKAWDRNLTDENGPYIELMTGVFTDNQPDFTYLKPYESKAFTQYFMPYKECGAVKNANTDYAVNLEQTGNEVNICVYSCARHENAVSVVVTLEDGSLSADSKEIYRKEIRLGATEWFSDHFDMGEICESELKNEDGKNEIGKSENDPEHRCLRIAIYDGDEAILSYGNKPVKAEIPKPQPPMPRPAEIATTEELYLCGMHLEQYRHATYDPADYYLEGLKKDDSDIRLNNAYGKLLCKKGQFAESIPYFEKAIGKATRLNPNPYDCEPYYNLGIAYFNLSFASSDRRESDISARALKDKAYDAFYKATWDGNMQDRAFYMLALIETGRWNYEAALGSIDRSLRRNADNLKARGLKAILLRKTGRVAEAAECARESLKTDPLDMLAGYELSLLEKDHLFNSENYEAEAGYGAETERSGQPHYRMDNADIIETGMLYMKAGLYEEALRVFEKAQHDEPMIDYYRYYCSDDEKYLKAAENASPNYCFPNRTEDIAVLEHAIDAGGKMAAYYLGCLLYDKGLYERAAKLWESVAITSEFPTVHRNLALVYYNKYHDDERARKEMEKAFELDQKDPRVFYELDQLCKEIELTSGERLRKMEAHKELLETRDPLYTEYITLLNDAGRYEEAYNRIISHHFHPWEGGEGKITAQYKRSLIEMAAAEEDDEKAVKLLKKALIYPINLGEGRLIGQLDNDIFYYLAMRIGDSEESTVPAEDPSNPNSERKSKQLYLELAARGTADFASAMYYNDQPPEMVYFMALAIAELGRVDEAAKIFTEMKEYGTKHMNDRITIDYFAVSLPDFLIFEADLNKKNRKHCENMIRLGNDGLKKIR